ncbi:RNA-directed DNA polymerase [Paraneptunicella aestuarii]|uniref:reverse transcriptase domain-containing protein n=1 Tax=Paraneptunicella aestuarii TaxID=2831148 RepID=UPI001E4D4A1C|nr:reverse transcriptase domain-containing protein [Paraneptunicella aestuarii]UAA40285.1 RNA-directed DNA polymerase [Paraneptunicella aestuarii]
MTKRTFEQAFNAIFHDSKAFVDFCGLDVASEVETFTVSGREIFKTSDKFKKYLRFIDRVILRHLAKDKNVVHSFTKDKNTFTAVRAHTDSNYFFLTDIRNFYSNIKITDVLRILERDKERIPISDIDSYINLLASLMTFNGSVPVGFSTSPQLSNGFLFEFDCAVREFCESNVLTYTRYADDIIISGKSFEELSDLKEIIQTFLNKYASSTLLLNEEKTRITHLGNKVKILGLSILPNRKVTIDTKYKKKLELLLHFYVTDESKYKSFLEEEFKGSEKSLFGMLHYVQSIDPDYLEKLQRKYGVFALRTLMEERWNESR